LHRTPPRVSRMAPKDLQAAYPTRTSSGGA
jgi:hypothetical protein